MEVLMEQPRSQIKMIVEVPITLIDENGKSYKAKALVNNVTGEVNHVPMHQDANCIPAEAKPDN